MSARRGYSRILPSGRAVRYVEPSLGDYQKASSDAATIDLMIQALLPRVLTGITLAPVPEIMGAPVTIEPTAAEIAKAEAAGDAPPEPRTESYLDELAMLASVDAGAAGGWHELTYQSLRAKDKQTGQSLLEQLFEFEVADFIDLRSAIMEVLFGGKKKLPPPSRRAPIPTT